MSDSPKRYAPFTPKNKEELQQLFDYKALLIQLKWRLTGNYQEEINQVNREIAAYHKRKTFKLIKGEKNI